MGQSPRPYKAILLDLTRCAVCAAASLLWVFVSVRLVKDNSVGVLIVFAPSLLAFGVGAFFLWRTLNALRRRFFTSMGLGPEP